MSIKRRQRRAAQVHFAVLAEYLGRFYEFLSQAVQPSDDEVRDKFMYYNKLWHKYCAKKQLSISAYDSFTKQVAQLWERKKTKSADKIMN